MKKLTFERDFNEVNFYMTAQLPEQLINNHPTVDFGEHKSREVAGAINNKVRWHKGLFGKIPTPGITAATKRPCRDKKMKSFL